MSKNNNGKSSLPTDLIKHIAEFLTVEETLNLKQVNKSLNQDLDGVLESKVLSLDMLYLTTENTAESIEELADLLHINRNLNFDIRDDNGNTALMIACKKGNLLAANLLTEKVSNGFTNSINRSDVNAINPKSGMTSLLIASSTGNLDLVKLLLQEKADPDIAANVSRNGHMKGSSGLTPTHYAAMQKESGILQELVNAGANLNVLDNKDGRAPIHCAISRLLSDNVEILINGGADVNIVSRTTRTTPLYDAAAINACDIITLLLDAKEIKINSSNTVLKKTPLHIARGDAADLLRSKGASYKVQDTKGRRPLHLIALGNAAQYSTEHPNLSDESNLDTSSAAETKFVILDDSDFESEEKNNVIPSANPSKSKVSKSNPNNSLGGGRSSK